MSDQDSQVAEHRMIMDNCPVCQGMDSSCPCRATFHRAVRYIRGQVRAQYWSLTLETISDRHLTQVKKVIRSYIDEFPKKLLGGRGCFISGPPGQKGKSSLAMIIVKEGVERGKSVFVASLNDLQDAFNYKLKEEDTCDLKSKLFDSEILVLDNIGDFNSLNTMPRFLKNQIVRVYEERCRNRQVTIITSSLHPAKIPTVFGEGIEMLVKDNADFCTFWGDAK